MKRSRKSRMERNIDNMFVYYVIGVNEYGGLIYSIHNLTHGK